MWRFAPKNARQTAVRGIGYSERTRSCSRIGTLDCPPHERRFSVAEQNAKLIGKNLMERFYYSSTFERFRDQSTDEILGIMARNSGFADVQDQKNSWLFQIDCLKQITQGLSGNLYFEYSIPRMGTRVDAILVIAQVIFVLEFKVGDDEFKPSAKEQVWDYALDLKNFHETSHEAAIAPILIATDAVNDISIDNWNPGRDGLISPPLCSNVETLRRALDTVLEKTRGKEIDGNFWANGRYSPTPTIIEAATVLYRQHSVDNIARTDASARNLRETGAAISEIISGAEKDQQKVICFVTGVPGAGKTLVGLDAATKQMRKGNHDKSNPSVFLSGNGPLVSVLTEVLARDNVENAKMKGRSKTKAKARGEIRAFIQNVHHYRDEYLKDRDKAPVDHVAIFDEAQRAWNRAKTTDFMKRRKRIPAFNQSEPEFLISCLDRHQDWAAIICLVGGGQEIYSGEAGIGEWINSLNRRFPKWQIFLSERLHDSEYGAGHVIDLVRDKSNVHFDERLHLSVSMRSFRAEKVSAFVKAVLDLEAETAAKVLREIGNKYPIFLTRDLKRAKHWLRNTARGSERYGLLASSTADRLKAEAINVRAPMNPVHWFLEGKSDVRSSFFLEDVATEFQVQGLEVDWACVTWDADFRYKIEGWSEFSFVGTRWNRVTKIERKAFLKNAYRVLLTRARQGMVICVPEGDLTDETRRPEFYDGTFRYLKSIGLCEI